MKNPWIREDHGKLQADLEYSVRPYRPEDREKVRDLCCETGFFGYPIEHIFLDKKWFADLNTKYYLKHEPDSCFVAESDGKLIGYNLGCKHPRKYNCLFYSTIAIPLFVKAFLKCFFKVYDKKSRMFITGLVFKASRERPKKLKNAAHLHMNIKTGYRTHGVGRALGKALVKNFDENGVDWVCGEVFHSDKMRDVSYYSSWGFQIYDKKVSTLFGDKPGKIYMISVIGSLKDPRIREIWEL